MATASRLPSLGRRRAMRVVRPAAEVRDVVALADDLVEQAWRLLGELPQGTHISIDACGPQKGKLGAWVVVPGVGKARAFRGKRVSELDAGIANHLNVRETIGWGPAHDTDAQPCPLCRAKSQAERRRVVRQWDAEHGTNRRKMAAERNGWAEPRRRRS